ncbi:uncharacterized protein LOC110981650 [Acanthaster planci]|uniref:Uncharacterized protein LOC110981650 n=1 Tax=Acanthaster planci TaxID=133434 RepID=A0A8B7YQX3_ACAPL|nr:uncharacterized protein LOC110981650 [Acanthaster planci]
MTSSVRQVVFACLLLAVIAHTDARRRRPFIPGKTEPKVTDAPVAVEEFQDTREQDDRNRVLVDMERRMANIEESTSIMKREMLETKSENTRLKEEIQRMSGLMEELDAANGRVGELEWMLSKFENFFGVLYIEHPDFFAREMTVDKRLSALNEYIGNREAELMALRPNPPVVTADPAENPVDEELMGVVIEELSSENAKLKRRLDDMETRMVSVPGNLPDGSRGGPAVTQPDEETRDRLTRLERLMALHFAPQLDEEYPGQNPDSDAGGKRLVSGGSTTQRVPLSESDTEILKEELDSIRSISSTRKSVFSAAATRHVNGEALVHKPVFFDHVFSNKGNHFKEHNSTFICGITGYYFITFTVRSYDNRHLGINMLLNGDRVTSVSGEKDQERNQMMTQSVVLHLSPGDKIWLTVSPATTYAIYSDPGGKYCTFSGFLLFKGSQLGFVQVDSTSNFSNEPTATLANKSGRQRETIMAVSQNKLSYKRLFFIVIVLRAVLAKPSRHTHGEAWPVSGVVPVPPVSGHHSALPHRPWSQGRPLATHRCTCDETRLSQTEQGIADLIRRMEELETQSNEESATLLTLEDSNHRLQTQISRVVGENQRLTRLNRSLQTKSDAMTEENLQLRAQNERLRNKQDQPQPVVDRLVEQVHDDPVQRQRSSLQNLNDIMGNREAELIEMGVFPQMEPATPEGPPIIRPDRRRGSTFSTMAGSASMLPDSEQIATSLLALNQENDNLKRRIGQLEERLNQQGRQPDLMGPAPGMLWPQVRPTSPSGQSSSELAEKISQVERLVLVALHHNPTGPSAGHIMPQPNMEEYPGHQSRPEGPLTNDDQERGSASQPTQTFSVPATDSVLSDDDLEAMADVVDRVRNKSPAKSAFSVASTGVTVGATDDPRAIEFDHEYVNKGGDFKRRRSRFVCENPGFYYVTFTLRSYDNKYLGVSLMKNEELQTAVYADSSERNVMQSQAVILHLEPGDELWLRHAPSEHFAVHSGEHRFVTFSGYLIYRGY